MAQVKVRELDDWIVSVLSENASLEGHSLEQHLRGILKEAALANQKRFAKEQLEHLAQFEAEHGMLTDSAPGIREDRELRG
jgi:plasmid stability protein